MKTKTGRYSGYIRPFSFIVDMSILNIGAIYLTDFPMDFILYPLSISLSWFIIAASLGFYEVYRYTKVIAILNCALKQIILFSLFCMALAFFHSDNSSFYKIVSYTSTTFALIMTVKLI